jgi:hypothetical protein
MIDRSDSCWLLLLVDGYESQYKAKIMSAASGVKLTKNIQAVEVHVK